MQIDLSCPLDLGHPFAKDCWLWLKAADNHGVNSFVDLSPSRVQVPLVSPAPTSNVRVHLDFNGNTINHALTGLTATSNGGVLSTDVKKWGSGSIYIGNNATDHVAISPSYSLDYYSKTLEMWVYPTTFSGNSYLVSTRFNNSGEGFDLYYTGTNIVFYGEYIGTLNAPHNMTLNAWNYVNLSQEGANGYITLSVNNATVATGYASIYDWGGTQFRLGNNSLLNSPARAYIDDFRLTFRATQPSTVPTAPFVADYRADTRLWTMDSSRGRVASLLSHKTTAAVKNNAAPEDMSLPYTIMMWVRETGLSPPLGAAEAAVYTRGGPIFTVGRTAFSGTGQTVGGNTFRQSGTTLFVDMYGGWYNTFVGVPADAWYHIIYINDEGAKNGGATGVQPRCYINGVRINNTGNRSNGSAGVGTNHYMLGNVFGGTPTVYCSCLVDDIRHYGRNISEAEAIAMYRDSLTQRYAAINQLPSKNLSRRYSLASAVSARIFTNKQPIFYPSGTGL